MAKSKKTTEKKTATPKEEVVSTTEATVEENPKKEVAPTTEEVLEAKAEVKEAQEEVSAIIVPLIEVEEEDLTKYAPDTTDEFAVFAKAKSEDKGTVKVKDHTLLKKVEGREFTLAGTLYIGELREDL